MFGAKIKPVSPEIKVENYQHFKIRLKIVTCDLGGDAGGDGWAEAFVRGGFEGEEVGGSWVETNEKVMGLVPQLEHPSPLCCQIGAGV